jgi:hypothetical protein
MKIIRRNFSEVNKEPKKKLSKEEKEKDPEYILDQGIVGGTTTSLIGGGLLAGNKYLTKKGIDVPRVKNMKKVGLVALPVGATLAGVSAYKKIKNKKSKK